MENNKPSISWIWGALALLILFNGLVLYRWTSQDNRKTSWDESIHTRVAYEYRDRLAQDGVGSLLMPAYFKYPPLYHWALALVLDVPEDVADAGAIVNFFYLALLIVMVFLTGRLLMNEWAGLAAATLVSAYPIIADIARYPMIDLSLTTWLAVAFYFLLKSDYFEKSLWSALFGAAAALAMLTKWTAFAYLAFPVLQALFFALRRKNWRGTLLFMGTCAVLMAPWYLINFILVAARVGHTQGEVPASGVIFKGWLNAFWYPTGLFEQIHVWGVLLLLPGLVVVFWRPKFWPVLLYFAGSLLFFSLLNNKNLRYSMPALPAVALLSVAWLPDERRLPYGVITAVALFFASVFQFKPEWQKQSHLGGFMIPIVHGVVPIQEDWKHDEIIAKVMETKNPAIAFTRIVLVSNQPFFHSQSLNISLRAKKISGVAFKGPSKRRWLEFAEFVLTKTGDLGPGFTVGAIKDQRETLLEKQPAWFKSVYREVGRWPLPDGSEAILFHAEPKPVKISNPGLLNMELEEMILPSITIHGLKLRATPLSSAATAVGLYQELAVSCRSLEYKGIQFGNVGVKLLKPQVNLPYYLETNEIQLLSLEALVPQATISSEAILSYAARKAKWLKEPSLRFEGERIEIKGKAGFVPVRLSVDVQIKNEKLQTRVASFRVAGIPIPLILLRGILNREAPLTPNKETAFRLGIARLNGQGDALTLEPAAL